jgi:hypothetical protein
MARRSVTTINKSGPFFKYQPGKTFRQNIRVLTKAIAAEGESDVKAQLRAGESGRLPLGGGIRPGRVSGHVVGRTSSLRGKPWEVTAVISVNNSGFSQKQGIKLMAAASWLESQGHEFRKTKNRIGRMRKINAAELLKGIA